MKNLDLKFGPRISIFGHGIDFYQFRNVLLKFHFLPTNSKRLKSMFDQEYD